MMELMNRAYYEAVRDCTPEDCGDCILLPDTNRACHMVDVDPRDEARMVLGMMDERDALLARVSELEAERDRLREALEAVALSPRPICTGEHDGPCDCVGDRVRAALEPR